MIVRLLSQGIILHNPPSTLLHYLEGMVHSRLIAPKLKREGRGFVTEDGDRYFYIDKAANDYYYHISQLENLKSAINLAQGKGQLGKVTYVKEPVSSGVDVKFKNYKFDMVVPDDNPKVYEMYGFQNEVTEKAMEPGRRQTIFAIQTGRGKTKSFQKVMVKKSKRTCIIVRPAYKDKWRNDCVTDKTGLYEPSARVRVATGVDGINLLIDDAKNGRLDRMNISTIIIPTTSLKLWLEWHSSSVSINRINLWEFYSILGVGNVGYDEIHEHFHTVYLAGMILNPPPTVEMSATLVPSKSKEFIRQRYLERFPLKYRLTIPVIRICKVGFFYYSIMVNKFLHRVDRMAMYNHKTFEDYLYQHSMLEDYFDMVYSIMVNGYLNSYQDGQRAIVFFSLVQTCTDFTEYVKRRLSEEDRPKLNVVRYVADDKYDDLMKADVAISTPGKAGTAIDLPGLVLALVTTAIDDRQLNEQIAGRPRKPTKWEMDPLVIFTHCRELTKHNRYLNSRMEALNLVAKKLSVVDTSYKINGIEKPNVHLSPTKSDIGTNTERGKQLKVLEKFKRRVAKKQRFDKRQRRKNFKRGRRG